MVTKQENDESSVKLLQFTQFLKKEYRDSLLGTSQLSKQQFAVLESLHVPLTTRGDDHWSRFYRLLEQYKGDHGHVIVPRHCPVPGLGDWVAEQRRQRKLMQQGNPASQMTPERLERLEALGFVWQVRQRAEWVGNSMDTQATSTLILRPPSSLLLRNSQHTFYMTGRSVQGAGVLQEGVWQLQGTATI